MVRWFILLVTHGVTLAAGFALGVYLLPILTAPPSLDRAMLAETAKAAQFQANFSRSLKGSDFLHWGEGKVSVTADKIVHEGKLSPGPDYKVYLVPEFADDEASFLKLKAKSLQVGDVKTFDGFLAKLPPGTDINAYTTVLIWCEAFSEFITAAKYR